MQKNNNGHIEEFVGKYETKNPISRFLINNFYNTIADIIPQDTDSILEIGCGAGFSTERIHHRYPEKKIEASDIDPALIELARERNPDITISKESIENIDRPDNSHNTVVSLEVLEHLEHPERALSELCRVSRRYVIVSVPNEPVWRILNMARGSYITKFGNTPGHVNHWSPNSFACLLKRYGELVTIKKPLPWIVILIKIPHDD